MTATKQQNMGWWGSFDLEVGESGYWRAGPLELWARRTIREWRVRFRRGEELMTPEVSAEAPTTREAAIEGTELRRFAFKESSPTIRIAPAPADRAFVIRPDAAFVVPAHEEATLYVSTPAWMNVHFGTSTAPLLSIPSFRPSDTWFGPNTRTGEVCYASRTNARRNLDDVTPMPHRVISVVRIRNRAPSKLEFERIKIPVPSLSIFTDTKGHLWTEPVMLDRDEDGDFAGLRLGKGAPDEAVVAGEAALVTGPRERHQKGLSIRTFGSLLG